MENISLNSFLFIDWVPNMINKVTLYLKYSRQFLTLRPRQNGRHFPDNIFKCIFLNEKAWISIKISLKFVPGGPINKIPALVRIMAWRRSGDKPLSEPMMVNLLTHICVTGPQWVNRYLWIVMCSKILLILLMLKPEYSCGAWSIPWLLMPWILSSKSSSAMAV